MNLNKLSYKAYGNLVISILVLLCIVFSLFPFSFNEFNIRRTIIKFLLYLMMIPIYLYSRATYDHPIHLKGLNKCFVFTINFYILLDFLIFIVINYFGLGYAFLLGTVVTCLATYFTSRITNIQEEKGKLFWGFKSKEESIYKDLKDYIRFNGLTDEYLEAEEKLKIRVKPIEFAIYKKIFIDELSWDKTQEILSTDENPIHRNTMQKAIDKCYNFLVGRLRI